MLFLSECNCTITGTGLLLQLKKSPETTLLVDDPRLLSVLVALCQGIQRECFPSYIDGISPEVLNSLLTTLEEAGFCETSNVRIDSAVMEEVQEASIKLPLAAYKLSATAARIKHAFQLKCTGDLLHHATGSVLEAYEKVCRAAQLLEAAAQQADNYYMENISNNGTAPYKLIIGGGKLSKAGWISVDLDSDTAPFDLRNPLPFANSSVSHFYAGFVLEHLIYPIESKRLLSELCRILTPNGVGRIVVPDGGAIAERYLSGTHSIPDCPIPGGTWRHNSSRQTTFADTLFYLGSGTGPDLSSKTHKFGYDFETLSGLCQEAGFDRLKRSHYMKSCCHELNLDESSISCAHFANSQDLVLFVDVSK